VLAVLREPHALVLARVAGQPLAAKPNLQSLLRCRWPPGACFAPGWVARVAHCVASALAYLHSRCICHGDVYAHNILADAHGRATLLDYGGQSFLFEKEFLKDCWHCHGGLREEMRQQCGMYECRQA